MAHVRVNGYGFVFTHIKNKTELFSSELLQMTCKFNW